MAELRAVYADKNYIQTSIGKLSYDYLVLACGTKTNFFHNSNIEASAVPMKTVSEAMGLRNTILSNFERAITCSDEKERQELLNVVIVGGGPSGVEIAGALAEMRKYVVPKDYPDMDISLMNIILVQGAKETPSRDVREGIGPVPEVSRENGSEGKARHQGYRLR